MFHAICNYAYVVIMPSLCKLGMTHVCVCLYVCDGDDGVVVVSEYRDWTAIHEREFAKMDSLDVYLEKREERRRRLKTPVKRAAAFAARLASAQQQQPDAGKVCTYVTSSAISVVVNCDTLRYAS